MINREPLQRSDHSGRKPEITAMEASGAGPGCSELALCNDATHDRRSEAGRWRTLAQTNAAAGHGMATGGPIDATQQRKCGPWIQRKPANAAAT
jgi:hypothetical protein